MVIKDGMIKKATESELHLYWIRNWDNICSWSEFRKGCIASGTEITETEEYEDDD